MAFIGLFILAIVVIEVAERLTNEINIMSDMRTWRVVSWEGETDQFAAYTESEARQDAEAFCADSGGVKDFYEI